jgi:ankyrin repeat protein
MRLLVTDLGARVDSEFPSFGWSSLCIAAMHGRLNMIRCLVTELGADAHMPSSSGHGVTPLLSAIANDHLDVARCLVKEYEVDVNKAEVGWLTPLIYAINNGKPEMVRWLVEDLGADVHKANSCGETSLHAAIAIGDLNMMRLLVHDLHACVDHAAVGFEGFTPLNFAAKRNQPDMLRCLVAELGADINRAMVNGNTLLHVAALYNSCDVARFLVKEYRFNVNQAGDTGAPPLTLAVREGKLEMARCLVIELGADVQKEAMPSLETPILTAIKRGDLDMMRLLVTELGADVNRSGLGRLTALNQAAYSQQIAAMRCLVEELGASIAVVDGNGDTALLFCARLGRLESVRYLLEHGGAAFTETTNDEMTVWDLLSGRILCGTYRKRMHPDNMMEALLRVMVLRGTPPPALVASFHHRSSLFPTLVEEGARLRERLPVYRMQRRALLDAHCPILPPLQALVHGYDVPTTDEIWATGLGAL